MTKQTDNPRASLPDDRLRIDRRPTWLFEPLDKDIQQFLKMKLRTGIDLVAYIIALSEEIEALTAGDDHPLDLKALTQRRCRVCQCTEDDCSGCVELAGKPCSWSREDPTVCTACVL